VVGKEVLVVGCSVEGFVALLGVLVGDVVVASVGLAVVAVFVGAAVTAVSGVLVGAAVATEPSVGFPVAKSGASVTNEPAVGLPVVKPPAGEAEGVLIIGLSVGYSVAWGREVAFGTAGPVGDVRVVVGAFVAASGPPVGLLAGGTLLTGASVVSSSPALALPSETGASVGYKRSA
jgi:hypothetical protein